MATRDETKQSTLDSGSNSVDQNAKACEVLKRKIDELTRINHQLAMKTSFLSSSLISALHELEQGNADRKSDSTETKFTHDVRQQLIRLGFLPSTDRLTYMNDWPLSAQILKRQASPSLEPAPKKPSYVSPNDTKQSTESQNSSITNLQKKFPTKQEASERSVEFTEPKTDENDDFDDSDADSETIRAAFRMFAKQIGPALKREHRQRFGTAPTQSWLADQLLTRWDALDRHERRVWHQGF